MNYRDIREDDNGSFAVVFSTKVRAWCPIKEKVVNWSKWSDVKIWEADALRELLSRRGDVFRVKVYPIPPVPDGRPEESES